MKAMTALSAKKMGGEASGVRTLFDLTPAAEPSRSDADSFSRALKAAVRKTRGETKEPSEPRDVKKTSRPEDSPAANVHLPSNANRTESFGEHRRGQTEAAPIALAETAHPGAQPQQAPGNNDAITGVAQLDAVMAEFAVEAELATVGPTGKQAFAFQANSPPTTQGEAVPLAKAVPIPQDGQVQVDEFVIESAPENAREFGTATVARFAEGRVLQGNPQDGIVVRGFQPVLPENVPATSAEPDSVPVLTFLDARTAASANDEALLNEGFWNWSRPGEQQDGTNVALAKAPFDGVLQQITSGHQPQPVATQPVEAGYDHLFDQLVQGIRLTQNAEATEMHVHLKPDFLGKVSIRVLADEHSMRIEIRAENEVVRQVMQDNQTALHQRLAEKGFSFNQLSILADTGWTSHREPDWSFEPAHTGPGTEPETPVETGVEPVPLARSGTIDYIA